MTRHQYGISAFVTQTSFCEGSSGDLAKRRLFSQANITATSVVSYCLVMLLYDLRCHIEGERKVALFCLFLPEKCFPQGSKIRTGHEKNYGSGGGDEVQKYSCKGKLRENNSCTASSPAKKVPAYGKKYS